MRYNYIIISGNEKIPIDHDELEKALKCMQTKSIAMFRRGIVNGSYIANIIKDEWRDKGVYYSYDISRETLPQNNDKILPDLFSEVREKLLLANGDIKLLN